MTLGLFNNCQPITRYYLALIFGVPCAVVLVFANKSLVHNLTINQILNMPDHAKSSKLEVLRKVNRNSQEQVRAKIQLTKLVRRLEDHIEDSEKHPISSTQMKGIELLLQRTLPVLSASTVTADINTHNTSATSDTLLAIRALGERLVNGTAQLYQPQPESLPVVIDQQTQQVIDS